jgi:hypothetical protein
MAEMTLVQAAEAAINVQNACNLSGVLYSFAKAMSTICDEANKEGHGTAWRNHHPVTILFVDKLASLAGIQDVGNPAFGPAYDECTRLCKEAGMRFRDETE